MHMKQKFGRAVVLRHVVLSGWNLGDFLACALLVLMWSVLLYTAVSGVQLRVI
jgi:hypothetical protein